MVPHGRLWAAAGLVLAVAALVARADPPARPYSVTPQPLSIDGDKPVSQRDTWSEMWPELWPADPLPGRVLSGVGRPYLENFAILGGLDGAKGPEDLGLSANFGFRFAAQTAGPLVADWGLGLQIGTGVDYHRTATRFLHLLANVHDRTQSFATIGIFQRTESGLAWGVAYDFLAERYYTDFDLGQWRAQISYQLSASNEIGVWGTLRDKGDSVMVNGQVSSLEAINQWNLFFKHIWPTGVMTRGWVGMAEQHGRFVLGGPMGLAYYPGGGVRDAQGNRFAPMLPLANNPTFGVNFQP